MRSDALRKWLQDRGCRFNHHTRGAGATGHAELIVHCGPRSATLPLIGTHQDLDPALVRGIVEALGLDPSELPGPQSRV
ncbi:MAG TPA: hypothetical protein VMV26_08495 [Alphaproteobacteria bacterium]|jgi:hypothetical protein|nr:hypothetical protein [Alphaproteobacteria bacterium]